MQHIQTLIDMASKMCGSDTALARKLNVSKQLVSALRSGDRQITPQMAAFLADMVHSDVQLVVNHAVIDGEKDPERKRKLREILGKGVAAGVAAMSLISYSGNSNSATIQSWNNVTKVNITNIALRFLWRKLRRATAGVRSRERLLQRHFESMRPVNHPMAHPPGQPA